MKTYTVSIRNGRLYVNGKLTNANIDPNDQAFKRFKSMKGVTPTMNKLICVVFAAGGVAANIQFTQMITESLKRSLEKKATEATALNTNGVPK